jgi:3-dehydroquinate synthase
VTETLQDHGLRVYEFRIPAGEDHKSLATASKIWEFFSRSRLERGSVIIAMGGGVVGDLAGFAAANFLRGVPWVILPTSLLAMVDASIGGKTGVNLPEGKNLVGAFHSPRAVYADISTLKTLPEIEMKSGLAEVIKHGVIADPKLFEICEQGFFTEDIKAAISRAIAVKIKIVQEDPCETGLREVLNLGHTVGHAIEKISNYTIRHGEAVAMGMVAEARMSEALGIADPGLGERLSATLSCVELPSEIPEYLDRSELVEAMQVDKKRKGGALRFSLPVSIGEVQTGVGIESEDVLKMMS